MRLKVILIGVVMKVVRMGHHIEICSEMDKLNHLVKTMRTNKRCYFKPESIFYQCLDAYSLLAGSDGNGAEKGDPHYGGRIIWQRKTLFGTMSSKIVGKETKEKS